MKQIVKTTLVVLACLLVLNVGCKQASELENSKENPIAAVMNGTSGGEGVSSANALPGAPVITKPAFDYDGVLSTCEMSRWLPVQASPAVTVYESEIYDLSTNIRIDHRFTSMTGDILMLTSFNRVEKPTFLLRVRAGNSQGYGPWSNRYFTYGKIPTSPVLETPDRNAAISTTIPLFVWLVQPYTFSPSADNQHIRITDVSTNQVVYNQYINPPRATNRTDEAYQYQLPSNILQRNRTYSWGVRFHNIYGWGPWSGDRNFTVN